MCGRNPHSCDGDDDEQSNDYDDDSCNNKK